MLAQTRLTAGFEFGSRDFDTLGARAASQGHLQVQLE